jgi:hypothetical protein
MVKLPRYAVPRAEGDSPVVAGSTVGPVLFRLLRDDDIEPPRSRDALKMSETAPTGRPLLPLIGGELVLLAKFAAARAHPPHSPRCDPLLVTTSHQLRHV